MSAGPFFDLSDPGAADIINMEISMNEKIFKNCNSLVRGRIFDVGDI